MQLTLRSENLTDIPQSAFRNTDITSIVIPDNVTSIGETAFADCPELEEVSIGAGVISIAANVFENDPKLHIINNYALDPQTDVDPAAFEGIDKENCTLYVHAASEDLYRNSDIWGGFFDNIDVLDEHEGIESLRISGDKVRKVMLDGSVYITKPDGTVYNAEGSRLR